MRGDHARAAPNAFELVRLAREHDLTMWRAFGVFLQGWTTAASGTPADGIQNMRRGVELLRNVWAAHPGRGPQAALERSG
jgi:hypothetical protein